MPTADASLAPDANLIAGRYLLHEVIGEGGFARVYRATDRQIEREVALKLLRPELLPHDPTERHTHLARFEQEAKLAARLDHPHVVPIFDFGVDPERGAPFIVMALLRGRDLCVQIEREGAIAPARLWQLILPCVDALAEAHALGIVHKDIKPANLFLVHPGEARERLMVTDFGIAHFRDRASRFTQAGMMAATPHYVAPEYAADGKITTALDVYQLALVLVEALCGRAVVESSRAMGAMFQHIHGEFALPEVLLLSPLGPTLARALARDPASRYPDARAFARALREIDPAQLPDQSAPRPDALADTALAPRAGVRADIRTEDNVNPRTVALWLGVGGALALGVIAVLGGAWLFFGQPKPAMPATMSRALQGVTEVRLESVPASQVFEVHATTRAPLGSTPLTLEIRPGKGRSLLLEAPKRQSQRITLMPEDAPKRVVTLPAAR